MVRTAFFILLVQVAFAQAPQVPHKMNFAGITLTIFDDARREIQKDVDALTQHPKYFDMKVERARTYFPVIERIFREERLPEDFKYLVLQESALIADAVSVSDAVGFWQFKDFTAIEMGLRVDKEIDERMNIVSSTRAAAQYLKKNNYYFNNWVYALQAYQMGAGGVMRAVSDYESGTKHMDITSRTYWYVKKFIAHKVAFEGAVKGPGTIKVVEYENYSKKTLHDIAREVSVSHDELREYNKWVRKGSIPDDRKYIVSVPVQGDAREVYASVARANSQSVRQVETSRKPQPRTSTASSKKYIHGLPAIRAEQGDNASALATRGGVGLTYFLACNDLSISEPLIEGTYYYLKKKRNRSGTATHVVALPDESLWSVSQTYGVQLKRVMKLNPGKSATATLKPGTVVMLSNSTAKAPMVVESQPAVVFEDAPDGYFDWSLAPATAVAPVSSTQAAVADVQPVVVEVDSPELAVNTGTTMPATPQSDLPKAEEKSVPEPVVGRQQPVPVQHVVAQGETLYAISRKYNIGVMDIVNHNQLRMEDGIRPGQVLRLPSNNSADVEANVETEYIIHEVKASETLYSVARKYDVTIKDIMDWNNKKDFNLVTGEKIRIRKK